MQSSLEEAKTDDVMMQDEVVDSEEEEERKEEEKERHSSTLKLDSALPAAVSTILICNGDSAEALAKILLIPDAKLLGKVETTYHEKTKDTLKFYSLDSAKLLILQPEGMKGAFCNTIIDMVFAELKKQGTQFQRIVILDSLYKTQYSTTDTGYLTSVGDGSAYPIKFYKSSHAKGDKQMADFLAKYQPAGVLNIVGGFPAAMLVQAEMFGIPAALLVTIIDSHYVTAETLQAFTPIVQELLQLTGVNMEKISSHPNFKTVLRETNTRSNNIFN